ncbi:hypothetical protein BKK52_00805 [Rodentibacter trehalosifermentans]|uniref:HEPN domain-containing protein n=1 Tax=Rodentibacter trehalosifermentans TaxID=1908263 RepID=A0A1V3J6K4_9PAST|nr:hypothetical protein [Rodentibacter trehalosifermentans]OOF50720.1 hypothetical protein BKK52_00805 [Rodentibacter trehalosifermentans]
MISADDIYTRAKQLATSTCEVEQRECIKTLYYAVLHRIQEVCDTKSLPKTRSGNMGTHESMIERINVNNLPTEKQIVTYAKKMKKKRVDADYSLSLNINSKDVQYQISFAEKCWYLLDK